MKIQLRREQSRSAFLGTQVENIPREFTLLLCRKYVGLEGTVVMQLYSLKADIHHSLLAITVNIKVCSDN